MEIPSDSESVFFLCAFGMLAAVVTADGKATQTEIDSVIRIIDTRLPFDAKRKKLAKSLFKEALKSPLEMRDYALRFKSQLSNRIVLRDQLIELLLQVSLVDQVLHPREDSLIRSAALLLDLSDQAYERLKRKHIRPEQELQ